MAHHVIRTAAPINIVNSAVQDFNDPRLFTASVGQSAVTVQCSDPSGTIYTIFNVNPNVPGGLGFTKSIDNGLTWSAPVYVDGPTYTVYRFHNTVAKYGSKLFGIRQEGAVYTYYNSSDCGQTWALTTPFIDNLGNTVGTYHIGSIENIGFRSVVNGIARTTDGLTWTNISLLPFLIGYGGRIRSVGGTKFIATGYTGTPGSSITMTPAISISTDSGLTWGSAINLPGGADFLRVASDIAISGTTLFALIYTRVGNNNGAQALSVSKSTDGGSSWGTPYTIINTGAFYGGNTILVSGSNIIIAYVDITTPYTAYIIRSTDNGVSWLAPVNLGLADNIVNGGAMMVKSGPNLVVSLINGVSVSTNNGVSWSFVSIPNLIAGNFSNGGLIVT